MREERRLEARAALGPAATYTFAEAALAYMQAGGERRFLARILEYAGPDLTLRALDNAWLDVAAAALFPDAAPGTINRNLIVPVAAVYNRAVGDDLAVPRRLRRRKDRGQRTRYLTPEEAEALLRAAAPHLRAILAVLLGSGMRVGEALAAEARNFHAATGEIWIDRTKSDHPRMIRLPGRARDLLLAASPPDLGALLRRPDGRPYILARGQTPIKTAFQRARGAAGLGPDVTPHVLRHTWATWYHAQTRDFGGLLDLGGWREPRMAQRYRKIAPEDLAERLDAAGWNFRQLGRDLPPVRSRGIAGEAPPRLQKTRFRR